jgi:hypothetical protein
MPLSLSVKFPTGGNPRSEIPETIIVAGGFLLHFGIFSSIIVNQIAVWSGVGYAMSAKLKGEKKHWDKSQC